MGPHPASAVRSIRPKIGGRAGPGWLDFRFRAAASRQRLGATLRRYAATPQRCAERCRNASPFPIGRQRRLSWCSGCSARPTARPRPSTGTWRRRAARCVPCWRRPSRSRPGCLLRCPRGTAEIREPPCRATTARRQRAPRGASVIHPTKITRHASSTPATTTRNTQTTPTPRVPQRARALLVLTRAAGHTPYGPWRHDSGGAQPQHTLRRATPPPPIQPDTALIRGRGQAKGT